jgi:ATP-binding protein involved in chromosome partitioning
MSSNTSNPQPSEDEVLGSLDEVYDPCSCFTENPVSIVELGLIDDVSVSEESVKVDLLPTSTLCLYVPDMCREIERTIEDEFGIENIEVHRVTDKIWTPDRMAEDEREARRDRMESRLEEKDITPYVERGSKS